MYKFKPWDGAGLVNKLIAQNLIIDSETGNIYYYNSDGILNLWCTESELTAYIHHLNQIEWRK